MLAVLSFEKFDCWGRVPEMMICGVEGGTWAE